MSKKPKTGKTVYDEIHFSKRAEINGATRSVIDLFVSIGDIKRSAVRLLERSLPERLGERVLVAFSPLPKRLTALRELELAILKTGKINTETILLMSPVLREAGTPLQSGQRITFNDIHRAINAGLPVEFLDIALILEEAHDLMYLSEAPYVEGSVKKEMLRRVVTLLSEATRLVHHLIPPTSKTLPFPVRFQD